MLRTLVGGLLTALGLIFVIIPGPSLLLIIPGLLLLSYDYPKAKKWLKVAQKALTKSARFVDKRLAK